MSELIAAKRRNISMEITMNCFPGAILLAFACVITVPAHSGTEANRSAYDAASPASTVATGLTAPDGNGPKRYALKSGIVRFKFTGARTGDQTVYFDDYGRMEANYTQAVTEFEGMQQATNTLELLVGEYQYAIDLEEKSGMRMKELLGEALGDDAEALEDGDAAPAWLRDIDGVKTGTGTVLGRTCDIWEVETVGSKIWLWNGLPLKMTTDFMGMNWTAEAVAIEENVPVPAEKFQIPEGIEIEDMPGM